MKYALSPFSPPWSLMSLPKPTSPQTRDTPPLEDFQSATETTDLSVSTALLHHAQEPMDQRMAQPVPHASKTSLLISLTTTPTQLPEDHTPPPVTEPELRTVSATTHPHLTTPTTTTTRLPPQPLMKVETWPQELDINQLPQPTSQTTTQQFLSNSQSHNQSVPSWPNSTSNTEK